MFMPSPRQLPDMAEPVDAERRAAQPVRQGAGPVAALHALGFERDIAARRDHQRDGELGRRDRRVAHPGRDRDAELGAGLEIDHLRIAADQRDQLELRQADQQRAREFHALADRHHDVGVGKPLDQLLEIARGLAVARHVVMADQREAGKLIDHVLVVVGNNDFHGADCTRTLQGS
jgi:hypothetical protein